MQNDLHIWFTNLRDTLVYMYTKEDWQKFWDH